MEFASVIAPVLMFLEAWPGPLSEPPPPRHSTNGVPLIVRLVLIAVFHIAPVEIAEFNTILPVPKFMVLVFVLLLAKVRAVSVNEPSDKFPPVRVYPAALVVVIGMVNNKLPAVCVIGTVVV